MPSKHCFACVAGVTASPSFLPPEAGTDNAEHLLSFIDGNWPRRFLCLHLPFFVKQSTQKKKKIYLQFFSEFAITVLAQLLRQVEPKTYVNNEAYVLSG